MTCKQLDRLCTEYPLSQQWTRPALVRHVAHVGRVKLRLAGLASTNRSGECVTGSAGQLRGSPISRAYFELVERTSTVEALACESSAVQVCDSKGQLGVAWGKMAVFPESPVARRWRYARSNGVAVGTDWKSASHRAELELKERDRILRSWYGELQPERIQLPGHLVPEALEEQFEFQAYVFGESGRSVEAVTVSAVLGFPREKSFPLVFGFGARPCELDSVAAAADECLQRLGFLWGEDIPSEPPQFAPTPGFHQDYFLYPPNHSKLRAWLRGEHTVYRGVLAENGGNEGDRQFVDLTPAALRSRLVVVKALSTGELPLTFGYGHPMLRRAPPEQLAIHPIS